jgi:hypothetical protein
MSVVTGEFTPPILARRRTAEDENVFSTPDVFLGRSVAAKPLPAIPTDEVETPRGLLTILQCRRRDGDGARRCSLPERRLGRARVERLRILHPEVWPEFERTLLKSALVRPECEVSIGGAAGETEVRARPGLDFEDALASVGLESVVLEEKFRGLVEQDSVST